MLVKKLIGALFLVILISSCSQEEPKKIPGSYKSLDMMSSFRAYPNADIPNNAYSQAYNYIQKELAPISNRSDSNWEAMGPTVTAGRTLTIGINPQDELTIYAGSASGGLWRSRNLGLDNSWERIETGFPVLGVSTIEFAPQDSSVMLIGTGEVYNIEETGNDGAYRSTRGSYGVGILKSRDGGQTWEKTLDWSYSENHGVWMIKISEINPEIAYAATTRGIYRSLDSGDSWELVFEKLMATDIEISPESPSIAVASFGNFDSEGKGIFYTFDGGLNWEESSGVPPSYNGKILLARSKSDSNIMYASVGNGFTSQNGFTWLLKSTNGGIDFDIVNTTDYSRWQGWFSHDVAIHPEDPETIVAVGIDGWKSTNGGNTLQQKSSGGVTLGDIPTSGPDGPPNYLHSDNHFVTYHPTIEDLVLIGSDGGVFLSFDGAETFRSANIGYQSTQFYNGFSVSQINPELALGGLQDNSTSIFSGTGAWRRAIGGDGSWTGVSAEDPNVFYGSSQNLNMVRTQNGGQSFQSIRPPGSDALFIAPFVVSPSQEGVIYAANTDIYRSNNRGSSWSRTGDLDPEGNPVFALDISDIDADVVYAATVPEPGNTSSFPKLWITQDGDTWEQADFDFPQFIPNDIQIYPGEPGKAIVVFSGFGGSHVFRTEDFGQNWQDIHGNLPSIPTNAAAINPNNTDQIFIGNDLNVFVSNDGGGTYELYDEGLPTAMIVLDLKVSTADNTLWVATHGNGTYRRPLDESAISSTEIIEDIKVKIYPNPATDFIQIESPEELTSIQLFNENGQLIMTSKSAQRLNISNLPEGAYIIAGKSENHRFSEKIIIQ